MLAASPLSVKYTLSVGQGMQMLNLTYAWPTTEARGCRGICLDVLSCRLGVCHLCSREIPSHSFLLLSPFSLFSSSLYFFFFCIRFMCLAFPSFFLSFLGSFFCHSNSSSVAVQDHTVVTLSLSSLSFRWIVTLCV